MLTIKDHNGADLVSLEIGKGSKRVFMLMSEDYITLKFSLAEPVRFGIGSYVIVDGFGRFELTELYQPKQNAKTGGWDYEIQLDAHYIKWKNKIFKYNPEDGGGEASWNLTATLATHLGVFLRNLVALGYDYNGVPYTFAIDSTVSDSARLITYESKNMLDALYDMADTYECEVWVEDSVIHFGKCEYGEAVDFRQDVNVESMSAEGNRATYATRLYAFGSERNIPKSYRPISPSITVNGVVQKRLMLPADTPYIDSKPNLDSVEAVEQVIIFDDVYPRTQSEISDITTVEYDEQDEDGNATGETWTAYRFKVPGFAFNESYILPDTDLQVVFQTGSLAGMTFNVKFNPLEVGASESDYQLWEIIRNEDYGRPLPDDTLKPTAGDKIVVIGWDTTQIASLGLISAAEQELKQRAIEKIKELKIDPANYRCKMISATMIDDGGAWQPYTLGSRVNLINQGCFESGQRASRIIGYEYDLARPFNSPVYVVGEKSATSRTKELESKIEALTIAGQTYNSTGNGSNIYVIRTNDSTAPSDTNVFSALRTKRDFLSRLDDDTTQGLITFARGLISQGLITAAMGEHFGAYLEGVSGAKIDAEGNAEVDTLIVRNYAQFANLIVNNISAQSDRFSFGDYGTIENVIENPNGGYWLQMEDDDAGGVSKFRVGDILYGYLFDLGESGVWGKCWLHVTAVNSQDGILTVQPFPDSACPGGRNCEPRAKMVLNKHGNSVGADLVSHTRYPEFVKESDGVSGGYINTRQQAFYIDSSTGRLEYMAGVNQPQLIPQNYAAFLGNPPDGFAEMYNLDGVLNPYLPYLYVRGVIRQDEFVVDYQGYPVLQTNYRGVWSLDVAQGDNPYVRTPWRADTVSHENRLWQCNANGTTDEPSESNGSWAPMTNDTHGTMYYWTIVPSATLVTLRYENHAAVITPPTLSCYVHCEGVDDFNSDYSNAVDLREQGVWLQYSMDGINWHEYVWGEEDSLELEDGNGYIEAEDSSEDAPSYLTLGGDTIQSEDIGDRVYFRLSRISTGAVLASCEVPVLKDGVAYEKTDEYYIWHNSGEEIPGKDLNGWVLNKIPDRPADESYRYLWNYEKTYYNNGYVEETDPQCVNIDGREVVGYYEEYAVSSSILGCPALDSDVWNPDKSAVEPTNDFPYLWNKSTPVYAYDSEEGDTPTEVGRPVAHLLSIRGEDGEGVQYIYTLTSIEQPPQLSNSEWMADAAYQSNVQEYVPDGWYDNPPQTTAEYPYCWYAQRKRVKRVWGPFSGQDSDTPYLWGVHQATKFKAFVFCRFDPIINEEDETKSILKPYTPTGGSYNSPGSVDFPTEEQVATYGWCQWTDGPTSGSGMLWVSVREFCAIASEGDAAWSEPAQMSDTADIDICFSAWDGADAPPDPTCHGTQTKQYDGGGLLIGGDASAAAWHDEATSSDIWMALSYYRNGDWSDWQKSKIKGEKGEKGQAIAKSFMFARRARGTMEPDKPASSFGSYDSLGESYTAADGTVWTDGMPDGDMPLWMTTRIFTSDGEYPQEACWSTPTVIGDTPDFDVCFSAWDGDDDPPDPTCHGTQTGNDTSAAAWHDEATSSDIWMATCARLQGQWFGWNKVKVKGEQGEPGENGVSPSVFSLHCNPDAVLRDNLPSSVEIWVTKIAGEDVATLQGGAWEAHGCKLIRRNYNADGSQTYPVSAWSDLGSIADAGQSYHVYELYNSTSAQISSSTGYPVKVGSNVVKPIATCTLKIEEDNSRIDYMVNRDLVVFKKGTAVSTSDSDYYVTVSVLRNGVPIPYGESVSNEEWTFVVSSLSSSSAIISGSLYWSFGNSDPTIAAYKFAYDGATMFGTAAADCTISVYRNGALYTTATRRLTFMALKDGDDADPADAVICYFAGDFQFGTTYTSTGNKRPYVHCENSFYLLKENKTFASTTVNPKKDCANNGASACWEYIEQGSITWSQIVMADFAKLGSAVFYDRYMMSQWGTIASNISQKDIYFGSWGTSYANTGQVSGFNVGYKFLNSTQNQNTGATNAGVITYTMIKSSADLTAVNKSLSGDSPYLWIYVGINGASSSPSSMDMCVNPNGGIVSNIRILFASSENPNSDLMDSDWGDVPNCTASRPYIHVRAVVTFVSSSVTRTESAQYQNFTSGIFEPNFLVDLYNGKLTASGAVVRGSIQADQLSLGCAQVSNGDVLTHSLNVLSMEATDSYECSLLLPKLASEGISLTMQLLCASLTPTGQSNTIQRVYLWGATSDVLVTTAGDLTYGETPYGYFAEEKKVLERDFSSGSYQPMGLYLLTGFRLPGDGTTYWNISHMDANTVNAKTVTGTVTRPTGNGNTTIAGDFIRDPGMS